MKQKALYAVIFCALLAGVNGLLIKYMTSLPASALAFLRTAVPAIILLIWLLKQEESLFRGSTKKMLFASALNALRMYLYLLAFKLTTIGNAVIILYTWPIFVTILGILFLKEHVSKKHILLIAIAFIGLIISSSGKSFSFENTDLLGMLAAIASAFGYAVTVIIFKSESKNYHRNEMIFFQNVLGVFIFLPFFMIHYPNIEPLHLATGVFYGFLIGIVIFSLFFFGLKYLDASLASSLMYLEAVSAIILAYVILGESLTGEMIIGGSLIIGSSFLINRLPKTRH